MNILNRPREPQPFEEVVGTFRRYQVEDDFVIIILRDLRIKVPIAALSILELAGLKTGDRITILRTDDELKPIRVRRLK